MREQYESKRLPVPLFPIELVIIRYNKPEDLVAWVEENHPNFTLKIDPDEYQAGFFEIDSVQHLAFLMDEDIEIKHIVHECNHAVNNTHIQIHQKLDPDNDEFQSYLLGWYVDVVTRFLNFK